MTTRRNSGPVKDEKRKVWTQRVRVRQGDGTVRHVRVSAATKDACVEKVARLSVAVADRTYRPPSRQTLGEYLGGWLDGLTVKPSTAANYRAAMTRYLVPRLGHVRLDQLDVGHLDRLYRDLSDSGLAPGTIRNHVHSSLRKALNDAVKKGYIPRNPATFATLPATNQPEMKTWTAPELDAFLDAEEASPYHPIWSLLATTGCRRGEALGLRWQDLDLDGATAIIRQQVSVIDHVVVVSAGTKTGRGRAVGLDARTVSVLRAQRAAQVQARLIMGTGWQHHDLVFASPDGSPLDPESVSQQFRRRVAALGLPRIRLHDLRHSWATLALEAGLDVKIVANRLGHSSTTITRDVYQHVSPATDTAAAELVAGLIFGARSAQSVPKQRGG